MKLLKTLLLATLLASSFIGCAHKHGHEGKKECASKKQCDLKKKDCASKKKDCASKKQCDLKKKDCHKAKKKCSKKQCKLEKGKKSCCTKKKS